MFSKSGCFVFSVCHFPFSAACLRYPLSTSFFLSITANGSSRAVQAGFVFVLICFFPYTLFNIPHLGKREYQQRKQIGRKRDGKGLYEIRRRKGFLSPFFLFAQLWGFEAAYTYSLLLHLKQEWIGEGSPQNWLSNWLITPFSFSLSLLFSSVCLRSIYFISLCHTQPALDCVRCWSSSYLFFSHPFGTSYYVSFAPRFFLLCSHF